MTQRNCILSIDDDKIAHKYITKALGEEVDLLHAFSGEEGIELAAKHIPGVILLDVDMPGMNGYEVCDKLKHHPDTSEIPVIFISARGEMRDRMQGYEAGGADYLVKPFINIDLLAKINLLIKYQQQQNELEAQVLEAQKAAVTAMSGSSELGQVMQFVERSYTTNDLETLANNMFMVTRGFGLRCIIVMETISGEAWYSCSGTISPLEQNVMGLLKGRSRFQDFGCRTQVNYANVSLLVKNMPLDNMELYGRIKDWLPALLGAADARTCAFNTEQAVLEQTKKINHSIKNIREILSQLSGSLTDNQHEGTQVLRSMFDELNQRLPSMGLEDDQENYILDRIEKATQQAIKLVDAGQDTNAAFTMVLSDLEQLASMQENLIASNKSDSDMIIAAQEDEIMAVELF